MSVMITESAVVEYLLAHPDFFQNHPELLNSLSFPHGTKGTISLVEAKLRQQREQLSQQQRDLEQIQQNASWLDALLTLQHQLAQAQSLQQSQMCLSEWAKQQGMAQAEVRFFRDSWQLTDKIETQYWLDRSAFELIRLERFGLRSYYLGRLTHKEKTLLFLPQDFPIGSVALCLCHKSSSLSGYTALLVLSAKAEDYFHRQQSHEALSKLVNIVEQHFPRWLYEGQEYER